MNQQTTFDRERTVAGLVAKQRELSLPLEQAPRGCKEAHAAPLSHLGGYPDPGPQGQHRAEQAENPWPGQEGQHKALRSDHAEGVVRADDFALAG